MSLEVQNLTRKFGNRVAVNNASFTVRNGRLTGFVGANGAGKTTVMRMILGVLGPNSGSMSLNGRPLTESDRRTFGYMPEERGLYPKMKLREQMIYFARLHGLDPRAAAAKADALIETLGLTERAKDPIENLSLGNQQRAQVAVSLVHEPAALILDEPFSGLDPMAVEVILSVLKSHAARGIPVLLSSHQLDVVERLCDDLVIISAGKIVASGSIEDLRRQHLGGRHLLTYQGSPDWIREFPGISVLQIQRRADQGDTWEIVLETADASSQGRDAGQELLHHALEQGQVRSFAPLTVPLSEIFKEVIEQANTADEDPEGARA